MLIAELSFLFWLALSFQWEFNCKGSLKIAGIREKLDFVCALDAMVSKTCGVGQSNLFPSWFYRPAHQLKHSDITQFDWKMSKHIKDISFLTMASRAHTKFNFSRTPPMFKKPLKSNSRWKVSVSQRKKRELDNQHLIHVITLLNTTNIFRPTNAGKPGGRQPC